MRDDLDDEKRNIQNKRIPKEKKKSVMIQMIIKENK